MAEPRQLPSGPEATRAGAEDREHGARFYLFGRPYPGPLATTLAALPGLGVIAGMWLLNYPESIITRDSGAFATIARWLLQGVVPYRDLWDHKPPGVYAVDALAFIVAGPTWQAVVGLDLVFGIALVAVATWALRAFGGPLAVAVGVAWLAVFYRQPVLFEGGNFTEVYALLPMMAAIGLAGRGLARPSVRTAIGVGAVTGVALLFKPVAGTTVAAFLLVGLVTALRSRRVRAWAVEAAGAVLGTLAVLGVTGLVFAVLGALPRLVDAVVVYNRYYAPPPHLGLLRTVLLQDLSNPPMLLAFVLGLVAVVATRRPEPLLALVVLQAGLDSVAIAAQGRFYPHYFLLAGPSAATAVVVACQRFATPVPWLRRAAAAAVLVAVLGWTWMRFEPGAVVGLRALRHGQGISAPPAAAALAERCPASSTIYVWGAEPEYYFWSGRRPASRYFYLYPLQMPGYDDGGRVDDLLADLQRNRPCAILDTSPVNAFIPPLDADARASWQPITDPRGYTYNRFDAIYDWVAAGYRKVERVDGIDLYLRTS